MGTEVVASINLLISSWLGFSRITSVVGLVQLSPLRLSLLNGGIWVEFSFQVCLFDLSSSAQVHEMATFQPHNHNLGIFFKLNLIILYITN